MAVSFHLSGESPACDGMITSRVVRLGPTGWRPRIMPGSTSPITYPCAALQSSLLAGSLRQVQDSGQACFWRAWSVCFSPSMEVSSHARFGQVILISCDFCAFSVGLARNRGAILLAQLAGNHARRAKAPLVRSTTPVRR